MRATAPLVWLPGVGECPSQETHCGEDEFIISRVREEYEGMEYELWLYASEYRTLSGFG